MTNSTLIVTRQTRASGDIAYWTLNEPSSKNALNANMVGALRQACSLAQVDSGLHAIVLAGAHPAFCSGGSLGGFATSIGQPHEAKNAAQAIDPLITSNLEFGELLEQLCLLPQALVCVVDGVAMGGGFGLVCCADTVIATERSVFATPEVTLGVVPAQIAPFVQWRLGDKVARRLMLQGAKHTAAQMQALGLVDVLCTAESLQASIDQALQAHQRAASAAVAATKRLMAMAFLTNLPSLRHSAAHAFAEQLRGAQALEGLAAFAQKRKPNWAE
ncbi:MAG: enoyl-CoA hydratase-related protein [Cytophagales bacterium]|nr:enoyl-CoA hydratase-related protein [Cytophagales bacterium]